jgi:hypothetical protein
MALGSTQPLTKISTRNKYWGGGGGVNAAGAEGWQPYHLQMPIVLKSGRPNLLEPSGPPQARNGIALPLSLETPTYENRDNTTKYKPKYEMTKTKQHLEAQGNYSSTEN